MTFIAKRNPLSFNYLNMICKVKILLAKIKRMAKLGEIV